jgi:hypothetical protein
MCMLTCAAQALTNMKGVTGSKHAHAPLLPVLPHVLCARLPGLPVEGAAHDSGQLQHWADGHSHHACRAAAQVAVSMTCNLLHFGSCLNPLHSQDCPATLHADGTRNAKPAMLGCFSMLCNNKKLVLSGDSHITC